NIQRRFKIRCQSEVVITSETHHPQYACTACIHVFGVAEGSVGVKHKHRQTFLTEDMPQRISKAKLLVSRSLAIHVDLTNHSAGGTRRSQCCADGIVSDRSQLMG